MPKKPLYTGDPNASMTMCYKKLRRHPGRDLVYIPVAIDATPDDTPDAPKVSLIIRCRHCYQNPHPLS